MGYVSTVLRIQATFEKAGIQPRKMNLAGSRPIAKEQALRD
jgi:hypothetical protein